MTRAPVYICAPYAPGEHTVESNVERACSLARAAAVEGFAPLVVHPGILPVYGSDSAEARAVGLEVWFAPAAAVRHQMPASRTTFRYARRHAFDSARSRVIDRAGQPGGRTYLATRFPANLLKALGFAVLAALNGLILRTGAARKALVRAWRSCGYLYQIPRSLVGKI